MRRFKYKGSWYTKGDIIKYWFREWKIEFIGYDSSALIERKKKHKTLTGSVEISADDREFTFKLLNRIEEHYSYLKFGDEYYIDEDWSYSVLMKGEYAGYSLYSLFQYLRKSGLIKIKFRKINY